MQRPLPANRMSTDHTNNQTGCNELQAQVSTNRASSSHANNQSHSNDLTLTTFPLAALATQSQFVAVDDVGDSMPPSYSELFPNESMA